MRTLTLAAILALLCSTLSAQTSLTSLTHRPDFELLGWTLPATNCRTTCMTEIDVDDDGDLDLFVGRAFQPATLWLREGTTYEAAPARIEGAVHFTTHAVVADFDGDGYQDLYVARAPFGPFEWTVQNPTAGWDRLYMNRVDPATGERRLVNGSWSPGRSFAEVIQDRTLTNIPHFPLDPSTFFLLSVAEIRYTHQVIARDFDGDGDCDLALAHGLLDPLVRRTATPEITVHGMENAVYWNVGDTNGDGIPNFVDTNSLVHDDPDTPVTEDGYDVTMSVAAHDWDRDGDLDLVFGNFTDTPSTHASNLVSGAPNRYYEAVQTNGVTTFRNRSYRVFLGSTLREETRALEVADLDPNHPGEELLSLSYQDARSSGGVNQPPRLYTWDVTYGAFRELTNAFAGLRLGTTVRASLSLYDHDGDQDLDVMLVGPTSKLLRNDGGRFAVQRLAGSLEVNHEATDILPLDVDLDGDGRADPGIVPNYFVMGCLAEQNRLLHRTQGALLDETTSTMPLDLGDTQGTAVADVNGDGLEDLFLAQGNRGLKVWFGRPGARFQEESGRLLPAPPRHPLAVHAADFDQGNGIDLFVLERDGQHGLYLNDGLGTFTRSGVLPTDDLQGRSILEGTLIVYDFDGDSRLDILSVRCAAGLPHALPLPVLYWQNLGNAMFQDVAGRLPTSSGANAASRTAALQDVDRDGLKDLLIANDPRTSLQWQLWIADAQGAFRDASQNLPASPLIPSALASEFLNADATPDFYVGIAATEHGFLRGGGLLLLSGPDTDRDGIPNYAIHERGPFQTLLEREIPPLTRVTSLAAHFTDLDDDGDLDFLVGRQGASSVILERLAPNRWSPPRAFTSPCDSSVSSWAFLDVDGDQAKDLFLAGNAQAKLLRNRLRR